MPRLGKSYLDESVHTGPIGANARRLQCLVSSWSFSSLELSEQELVECAVVMFKHLISLPGNEVWHLPDADLFSFIHTMRRSYYATNPYHNFRHAVDVMQAVFYMLLSAGLMPQLNDDCPSFDKIDCDVLDLVITSRHMLAACIVGIGHDVGHPGVNNAFLVATKAPLALLYNDRSVLESMHCAALSRFLVKGWPATQAPEMRKIILELVSATDMALHFEYMAKFVEMDATCLAVRSERANNGAPSEPTKLPPATLDLYRSTLFAALIKCGDISNVARPFPISKIWSNVLLREFFNQARLEKSLNLPVTKVFDPELTTQADSQIFFINMFAHPLFSALQGVLPNLAPICATILHNRDTWMGGSQPQPVALQAATPIDTPVNGQASMALSDQTRTSKEDQKDSRLLPDSSKADSIGTHENGPESSPQKGSCFPRIFIKKKKKN